MNTITLTNRDNKFICSDRCKDNNVLKTLTRAVLVGAKYTQREIDLAITDETTMFQE